jgi:tRNA-2-methylthio-N6-dimethylallyladenosine synthase
VGFPGETEADFEQTLHVVREARFAAAFTFQYSKRPGTPAAEMPDQIPHSVVTERYGRLLETVNDVTLAENRTLIGREVEVLISVGEGKKDAATARISGRAPDNRLVHVALDPSHQAPRPGDMVVAEITHAAPHHLNADRMVSVRRTQAGDLADQPIEVITAGVMLCLPSIRIGE